MIEHLRGRRLSHGEQKLLARRLGVSARTLRTWKSRAGAGRLPGRPAHADDARGRARREVEAVWRELPRGHDGWRSVLTQLEMSEKLVPTRLVQACVRELKREERERERARIKAHRESLQALFRDAVWSVDQTELMRDEHGKLCAEVVSDGLSRRKIGLSIGPPSSGADVARLLASTAEARGGWPFVVTMDNGGENRAAQLEELLARNQVIVLWNLPRTPQHNSRAEHAIGELKLAAGLDGKARERALRVLEEDEHGNVNVLPARVSLLTRVIQAWACLDAHTPRQDFAGLTPLEIDRVAPAAEDRACRARFYAEVCEELNSVALMPIGKRARRKLAREAIAAALARHGLVTRTRGGRPIPTVKAEGDS